MKLSISLRAQVAVIVALLAVAALSATLYTARTIRQAQESILRLNRERLAALTGELARRYGSVINFISPNQIQDTVLVHNPEFRAIIAAITKETLVEFPQVEAGFFHLPSRTPISPAFDGDFDLSGSRKQFVLDILRRSDEEQRELTMEYEADGSRVLMVTKPVLARSRLVGVAWTLDDLTDEVSFAWSVDRTPLLLIVVVAGIVLASIFLIALRREVNAIRTGLERMKQDLSTRLTPSGSELGAIARSINHLAETIQLQQQEKEALQRSIEQKERLASLGQLVAGVAHEIRTPLAAIKTRVQLWQRGRKRTSTGRTGVTEASMNLVVSELNRMERIVQKLLYFAKERRLMIGRVNLHELLSSVLDVFADRMEHQRIDLERHFEALRADLYADRGELGEVFMNLFTNAIEVMPDGGVLAIATANSADGHSVAITIENTGGGIQPEIAGKMFDPFYTTKETGTGLGLSIAHEIVRAHAGRIEYIPTANGRTRFVVTFPLINPPSAKAHPGR